MGEILKEQRIYNCEQIEEVNSYCYLGLLLNFNGKFHVTQKQLSLYSPSLRSSEYITIYNNKCSMNKKSTCTCISQERCSLAFILYKNTYFQPNVSPKSPNFISSAILPYM